MAEFELLEQGNAMVAIVELEGSIFTFMMTGVRP